MPETPLRYAATRSLPAPALIAVAVRAVLFAIHVFNNSCSCVLLTQAATAAAPAAAAIAAPSTASTAAAITVMTS